MSLFGRPRLARSMRLRTPSRHVPALLALAFVCVLAFGPAHAAFGAERSGASGLSAPAAVEASASGTTKDGGGPLVVVGMAGLRWDDLSSERTPNLAAFVQEAATANLVVRTLGDTTCPAQGWLTLGAGQRAKDRTARCSRLPAPVPAADASSRNTASASAPPAVSSPSASGASASADDQPRADIEFSAVPEWEAIKSANASNSYAPRLGTLAAGVDPASTLAIGRGAALALAGEEGTIAGTYLDLPPRGEQSASANAASDAASAFADFGGAQASLVVVDLGRIHHGESAAEQEDEDSIDVLEPFKATFRAADTSLPEAAEAQVRQIDADFGALLEQIEQSSPHARILVASLADAETKSTQLQFFAARGLGGSGELPSYAESSSTRQTGLVQLTDLAPTVLSLLGTAEADAAMTRASLPGAEICNGAPVPLDASPSADTPAEDSLPISRLVDDHRRSQASRSMVGFVYLLMGLSALAAVAAGYRAWKDGTPERLSQARQLAAFAASLPASSLLANLLPWWRTDSPRASLVAAICVIAALVALGATARYGSHKPGWPLLIIGTVSFLTPALDVLLDRLFSGYPLQLASILGSQPQVGGRFYGLSNAPFAVFGAGLMMLLAVLAVRLAERGTGDAEAGAAAGADTAATAAADARPLPRRTLAVILALAGASVVIDGLSFFGADFGGPPALAVGTGALILAASGRRLTVRWAAAIAGIAVGVTLAFSLLDYLRPASERSHLGRFIGTVREGGLWRVVSRKMSAVFLNLPVPATIAIVALVALAALGLTMAWRRGAFHRLAARSKAPSGAPELAAESNPEAAIVEGVEDTADATSKAIVRLATIGTLSLLATAFFLNDSGIVIPFIGLAVAAPTIIAERLSYAS